MHKFTFFISLCFSFSPAFSMDQNNHSLITKFYLQAKPVESKFVKYITSQNFDKAYFLLQNFLSTMRSEIDNNIMDENSIEQLLELIRARKIAIHNLFNKIPAYKITPIKIAKLFFFVLIIQAIYLYLRESGDYIPTIIVCILFGIMKWKVSEGSNKVQNLLDQFIHDLEQQLALTDKNADRFEVLEQEHF